MNIDTKKTPMKVFRKEAIKDLIDLYGLTSFQFAESIEISHQLLSSWILGRSVPKTGSLLKIVNKYHVDMEYFFIDSDVYVHRYSMCSGCSND